MDESFFVVSLMMSCNAFSALSALYVPSQFLLLLFLLSGHSFVVLFQVGLAFSPPSASFLSFSVSVLLGSLFPTDLSTASVLVSPEFVISCVRLLMQ